jgi:hypothetical protein
VAPAAAPAATVEPPALDWDVVAHGHDEDEDGVEEDAGPKPKSYTWLQLIVLSLVGFVLGILIFMLLDRGSSPQDASGFPERGPVDVVQVL